MSPDPFDLSELLRAASSGSRALVLLDRLEQEFLPEVLAIESLESVTFIRATDK